MEFSNLNELYERLYPALTTRKNELEVIDMKIDEKKIWDDLVNKKWKYSHGLTLEEMVKDILSYKEDGALYGQKDY